jgi:hypothetical protein
VTSPLVLAGYRSFAAEHLDQLGWAIADTELVAVTRYAEAVPLLRVFHPALPCIGESVSVVPTENAKRSWEWWFRLSDGRLIAECDDLNRAVGQILEALDPILRVVARQRSAP